MMGIYVSLPPLQRNKKDSLFYIVATSKYFYPNLRKDGFLRRDMLQEDSSKKVFIIFVLLDQLSLAEQKVIGL